jgi:AP2 domain
MKTVPLHGAKATGRVALVDDSDFALVMQYRWCIWEHHRTGRLPVGPYAQTTVRRKGRPQLSLLMHSLITGYAETDHRDGDGLNNQRSNLRDASHHRQNMANRRKGLRGSSQFKGVSWFAPSRKWKAQIRSDGRHRYLGLFVDERDAARAYDAAALELWGEFARLNLP